MDSSLSLSSWYRGIHCYALYQSWWQTKNSCHFPFFQAVKSGNNGLGSVIESSGSQLIEVVSWSMICFPSQLFEGLGDGLTLTLDILKRKVYNTAPLVKSPRLLSWPELVWKNSMEMENNRFEREWVSTQRSRVRRLTGRRGYGHHWSPLVRVWISFFPRHILPLCFVVDPTNKVPYYIHWSRLINLEVIHSLMISRFATLVWQSVQTGGHLHNCTFAHVNNYLLWSLLVENAKPFKLLTSPVFTTMSQVHCHCQSSCHCQSCCHCHRQLPGSLTFWLDIKVTAIQLPVE